MDDYQAQSRPALESKPGHEPNTLVVRGLVGFAVALVAVGIVVEVILAMVMGTFAQQEKQLEAREAPRFDDARVAFPAPRLQADPSAALVRMKQEDQKLLDGYGWIDGRAGIAHIPIERAIDILIQTGLPVTPSRDVKTIDFKAPTSKPPAASKTGVSKDSGRDQKP